jgi:hypothetical protein
MPLENAPPPWLSFSILPELGKLVEPATRSTLGLDLWRQTEDHFPLLKRAAHLLSSSLNPEVSSARTVSHSGTEGFFQRRQTQMDEFRLGQQL